MRIDADRAFAKIILRDFSDGKRFAIRNLFENMGFTHYREDGVRTKESQNTSNALRGLRDRGVLTFEHERGCAAMVGKWVVTNEEALRTYAEGGPLPAILPDYRRHTTKGCASHKITPPNPASVKRDYTIDDVKKVVVDAASKITVQVVVEILKATAGVQKAAQVPPDRFAAVIDTLNWHMGAMDRELRAAAEAKIARTPVTHEEMSTALRKMETRQHQFEQSIATTINLVKKDVKMMSDLLERANAVYQEVLQKLNTMGAKLEAQHKSLQDARARLVEAELKLSGKAADPEEVEIEHARLHDPRYTPAEQNTIMNGRGGY